MTFEKYIEWLRAKGVKDDDEIIFCHSDGSGYTTEISSEPVVERWKPRKGWAWSHLPKEPDWILGDGTT